jgi:tRNA A37 threonylcarbamoyltransferase TsaD
VARSGIEVHFPAPALCTDNGAMIAFAGALRLAATPKRETTVVLGGAPLGTGRAGAAWRLTAA